MFGFKQQDIFETAESEHDKTVKYSRYLKVPTETQVRN